MWANSIIWMLGSIGRVTSSWNAILKYIINLVLIWLLVPNQEPDPCNLPFAPKHFMFCHFPLESPIASRLFLSPAATNDCHWKTHSLVTWAKKQSQSEAHTYSCSHHCLQITSGKFYNHLQNGSPSSTLGCISYHVLTHWKIKIRHKYHQIQAHILWF